MWFMAYGFMMFAYIMALRAKLSGDGFQFEVLLIVEYVGGIPFR